MNTNLDFKKLNNVDKLSAVDTDVNLIVEQYGAIKRMNIVDIPQSQTVKADWNETNEASPAFILNKPESLGGGNASVTYFIMSGDNTTVKIGENWDTAINVTKDAVIDAFNNGIVRMKYAADPNAIGTLTGYKYNNSGVGNIYYIASDGTSASFTSSL